MVAATNINLEYIPFKAAGLFTLNPFTQIAVNLSTSMGNNTLVTGQAGQLTKVYRVFFWFGGATIFQMQDGASTLISGPITLTAPYTLQLDVSQFPWWQTSAGNDLVINTTAGVQLSGWLDYIQS